MGAMKAIATTFLSLAEGYEPSLTELVEARDYLNYLIDQAQADSTTADPTPAVLVFKDLTTGQNMGVRCVVCDAAFNVDQPHIPVGRNEIGSQVFACEAPCAAAIEKHGVLAAETVNSINARVATETGQEN